MGLGLGQGQGMEGMGDDGYASPPRSPLNNHSQQLRSPLLDLASMCEREAEAQLRMSSPVPAKKPKTPQNSHE
eukprot:CAMPEP_0173341162 /NCGR_PEP_ID=MMETSP1144-20121109/9411_1 /TAXON_ID=483371 /ORGANISM="non described non described, Strain CCMP2298" /LENGTH=72 /DNA_ID=CAMNT_0014287439 /DNA_START=68 /DNA_END=286 /DNA_ORIENTATION=+